MPDDARYKDVWSEACAEADRVDPGWRWDELLARRPSLSADQDAIQLSLAAAEYLPPYYYLPSTGHTSEHLGTLSLPDLHSRNEGSADVMSLAHQLAAMRVGRAAPIKQPLMNNLPQHDWQQFHRVSTMLRVRAIIAAKEGRPDDALLFARAILGVALAPSATPMLMTVLLVNAMRAAACDSILQAMKYAEPSEQALADAQAAMQVMAGYPLMLEALRGERAIFEDLIQARSRGEVTDQQMRPNWFSMVVMPKKTAEQIVLRWLYGEPLQNRRAAMFLRYYTALAEVIKESADGLPGHPEVIKRIGRAAGYVTRQSALAFTRMFFVDRIGRGYLACTIAALASERYRRITGRWPNSLAEVPGCLERVPINPHTLESLDYQLQRGNVLIRSHGKKYEQTGGIIPFFGGRQRGDKTAELWSVEQRGKKLDACARDTRPAQWN